MPAVLSFPGHVWIGRWCWYLLIRKLVRTVAKIFPHAVREIGMTERMLRFSLVLVMQHRISERWCIIVAVERPNAVGGCIPTTVAGQINSKTMLKITRRTECTQLRNVILIPVKVSDS